MTPDPKPTPPTPTRTLVLVYRAGTALATAAMLAGFAWFLPAAEGCRFFEHEPSPLRGAATVVRQLGDGDPSALMQLGVVCLAMTPIARVAITMGWFARRREALFAVLCLAVLAILAGGWLA